MTNMKKGSKSLTDGLSGKVNMDGMATGMNRKCMTSSASTTLLHLLPPPLIFFPTVTIPTMTHIASTVGAKFQSKTAK